MPDTELREIRLLSPEFQNDPFDLLAEYRSARPVFQPADLPVFVLARYDDVAGMKDQSVYSTMLIRQLRAHIDGPNMIQMDGEEHRRNRSLISHAWRPRVIRELVHRAVPPLVERLLEEVRSRGRAELIHEFCEPLPFYTIIGELMGLEVDDQPRLSKLYKDMVASDPVQFGPETEALSLAAREELLALLTPALEERRRRPADDFLSQLVLAEEHGERLTDEEILGFLLFLLPAGEETTMSALGTLVLELLRRPDDLEAVRRDPSLIPAAFEESLRWRAPIAYVNRVTLHEIELHGVTVPEGALVLGSTISANRDPGAFPEPDTFDIRRDPNPHLAWGTGAHMCIGMPLARLEVAVALPLLLDALPNLRLAPGYEPRYEGLFGPWLTELHVEFDPTEA